MRYLRATIRLAQEPGKKLGRGEVLQRCLPEIPAQAGFAHVRSRAVSLRDATIMQFQATRSGISTMATASRCAAPNRQSNTCNLK